jgi:hypothetical protein
MAAPPSAASSDILQHDQRELRRHAKAHMPGSQHIPNRLVRSTPPLRIFDDSASR